MPIKKILVVDDSPTERLALSEVLVRHGGFDQSAWDEDCDRMIVTAQRKRTES